MSISIKELLALPVCKNAKLAAGQIGESRSVRWVTIFEVLEDLDQLEEGELLMTTAFDLLSNEELKDTLIPKLLHQGLSGIVIQTGYYLEEIPRQLLEHGEKYNFPIIEISKETTFSELTKVIHKYIMNKQFEKIHFSEKLYKELTEIALKGQGIKLIMKTISDLIDGHLKIFDQNTNELFSNNEESNIDWEIVFDLIHKYKEEFESGTLVNKKINTNDSYVFIAPINSNQKIYGYFVGLKPQPFNEFEEIAIQHASTISALEFIKINSLKEKENELQADFVEQLLSGNVHDELTIYSKGEALGYKIGTYDTCIVIVSIDDYLATLKKDNEFGSKILQVILKSLREYGLNVLFKLFSDKYVFIVSNPFLQRVDITHVFDKILENIKKTHKLTLSVAIGNYYKDFTEYKKSYEEALETLSIIKSVWKKEKCLQYNSLGLYKIFLPLMEANPDILTKFYKQTLGDLLDDEDLLYTLKIYLQKMKTNDTANELFIHRHTLKYRINKIESMLSRDLLEFKDRVEIELALVLYNMFEEQENDTLPH